MKFNAKFFSLGLFFLLSLLILILPLDVLEFLSLEIVGEPPINGRAWLEGVEEVGGEISMRLLGIMGIAIICLCLPYLLELESSLIERREVKKLEPVVFLLITGIFFIVNFIIGYDWWDPDAFLGMGPLFFHSMLSLLILGIIPFLLKKAYNLEEGAFSISKYKLQIIHPIMVIIAYGYGLVSIIWHCCSFFEPKMYFFFFITKMFQLWGMCSFFFKYGLKLFLNITKPWAAYLTISILFGFCYPWHTIGFAFTFTLFGFLLCYLTRKTDSYYPGLLLLYFAYIFHAALPWHGDFITYTTIYPMSLGIIALLIYLNLHK